MTDETMVVEDTTEESQSLPPGIKTEAVLSYLGNLSNTLREISEGINQTITTIITEGSKEVEVTSEEGETNNDETR